MSAPGIGAGIGTGIATGEAAGVTYAEAGQGAPVVCLHGIGGSAESFAPQLGGAPGALPPDPRGISGQMKEPAGFRVIAWDMPGYGGSAPVGWSFAALSDALGRFVAALGLERVHLVGHSIGGMLALEHALRRPEQVASLALIGTTPAFGGRDDSFKRAFLEARLAPLEAGQSMAEMAAEAAPAVCGPGADPAVVAEVARIMAAVPEATWRGILDCLVTFDRRADLGRVAQPCCLIAGGQDRNAPPRTMEKMAAGLPRAEYHLIEGAGHMINQEAPGDVNEILRKFWERHPL